MKKTTLLIAVASLATVVGCSYRSPEMYRDDTSKILESKQSDIRACYDEFLKGNPPVGGTITVKFEIETEGGKIQNVAVDKAGSTAPDALGACVKKNIEGLVLNPPDGRLGQATYVYEFKVAAPPPAAAPAPKS